MDIPSISPGRLALVAALGLLGGCASVLVLNTEDCEDGGISAGTGGGGAVNAGADAPPVDVCGVSNLGSGLVAHYTFDGDTSDTSGNGLHGTAEGAVSFVAGKFGQAIHLTGEQDKVVVQDSPPLDNPEEFSLAAWVNPDFYPSKAGANPVIMAQLYSSGVWGTFVLQAQTYPPKLIDAFSVGYRDFSGGGDAGVIKAEMVSVPEDPAMPKWIPVGKWTQVTATFDHGRVALYLDGKAEAVKVTDVLHVETLKYPHNEVVIGNVWDGKYTWFGAIDDVRIYNRALSEDEIACLAGQ